MEVTFFRHGIAVDRADPLAPIDFERPLTLEGKNRTEAAARGLRALMQTPALILTSPYRRCVQSARLLAVAFGIPRKAVRESDALRPDADPRALWAELALLGRPSALCVGHSGALEPCAGVALGLLQGGDRDEPPTDEGASDADSRAAQADMQRLDNAVFRALHLKKAGALQLEVDFEPRLTARLSWLLSPRILRQVGRR